MRVNFVSVTNTGQQKVVGTVKMVKGKVVVTTSRPGVQEMAEQPAQGKDGRVYTAKDGEKFLRALPYTYAGSRFFAMLVEE